MPGTDVTATSLFTTNQATIVGGVARGSEVNAFSPTLNRLFVLGAQGVDVVDPATGAVIYTIGKAALGVDPATIGTLNSVAVNTTAGVTRLAIAADGAPVTVANGTIPSNGVVAILTVTASGFTLDTTIRPNESAAAGPLTFAVPDMVTFTPDGSKLLVAIEGEPTAGYTHDPLGGVGIIDVATGALTIAGFGAFDAATLNAAGVRVFGSAPTDLDGDGAADAGRVATRFTATAAADLEPEYIAINATGTKAYVTLQEANALAVVDIATATVERIQSFGLKDFSQPDSFIDAADQNGIYLPTTSPVKGLYQPDGIATFTADGKTYLVTANEGDSRDYGALFNEEIRVAAAGLDTAVFPTATTLANNANLGRLIVSNFTNNTDADAQLEKLEVFGSRSFSIWEYDGATGLRQVFDSGSALDAIIARDFPALYDDGRADNKGAEPESVTLGTIDGQLFAFVGLERYNAVLSFAIDTTGAAPTASYVSTIRATGDTGPEVFSFAPSADGSTGTLFVSNEVSNTTSAFALDTVTKPNFTLQILHASDFEAGLQAVTRAPKFAAIVDKLEDQFTNSITLASGDNYIPSPFLAAQGDAALNQALRDFYTQLLGLPQGSLPNLATDLARYDIAIMNALGVQASVFGNHEFDLGTRTVLNAVDFTANGGTGGAARVTSIGALFPYLSANLDFSGDADLNGIFTAALRDAASYATTAADLASDAAITAENADRQISPWTVIKENGEDIGVLGVTTQILATISSLGGVRVQDPAGDGGVDNTTELAQILQVYVDQMTTQGIDKIILLSHLQQFQLEFDLATKLSGVDIIIAGGSHQVFADNTDGLGGTAVQNYPVFFTGADGNAVAVVNTGSEYFNVGRLVITFDGDGNIIPSSVDPVVSGAYVANDATVASLYAPGEDPYADGTKGGEVKQLVDAVDAVIDAKLAVVAGYSDVYIQGQRGFVRTQETNFGNLTADANLFAARQADPTVTISLKNGGGIREGIGVVGTGTVPSFEAPAGGAVTQLDIENALRFNNALAMVDITAENLVNLIENTLFGANPGATSGGFPHVAGLRFSFDATRPAGDRVITLAAVNEAGQVTDILAENGNVVGDPGRVFRIVALDFNFTGGGAAPSATGGDNWLGGNGRATVTVSNFTPLTNVPANARSYTTPGSEQKALADYFAARFATPEAAFSSAETPAQLDTRIQNLAFRPDAVLQGSYVQGTGLADTLTGYATDEIFIAGDGDDLIAAGAGNDQIQAGNGNDSLAGDVGDDFLVGGLGNDSVLGGAGADVLFGDAGDDSLAAGAGADQLLGGAGNDSIAGDAGADYLVGGDANDTLAGGADNDLIFGDTGDDSLAGGDGADQLYAGEGNDSLAGDAGDDFLLGGDANDSLAGGADNDVLFGDAGDDTLAGGTGADQLFAGAGQDSLAGDAGDDFLLGGDGNDTLAGAAGADVLFGDAGDDSLAGGDGADQLFAGAGNDSLAGDAGDDFLLGGDANDSLAGGADNDILFGDAGDDNLAGGAGADQLYAGEGNDSLAGEVGDDYLVGGDANDTLAGGADNDVLFGDAGEDNLAGGDGADQLLGGAGNDSLAGDAGTDYLVGGDANDTLAGGADNDVVFGDAGDDSLAGGDGADQLYAGDGNDSLTGDAGEDFLVAGIGNDSLLGGAEQDYLFGDAGQDTLNGGAGRDYLIGGAGSDIFVFNTAADGGDFILDFTRGADRFAVSASGFGGGLAVGSLGIGQFVTGATATASNGQFLYDQPNATLYWDVDGTGAIEKVALALIVGGPALFAPDFTVIA